jgi:D-arabinose 1-dehydrogenase-like Zn-dependent alcohol dehydrogenase
MSLHQYLRLLSWNGRLVRGGSPDDALPAIFTSGLIARGKSIAGRNIGPPKQIEEMLQLFVKNYMQTWLWKKSISRARQVILELQELARPRSMSEIYINV